MHSSAIDLSANIALWFEKHVLSGSHLDLLFQRNKIHSLHCNSDGTIDFEFTDKQGECYSCHMNESRFHDGSRFIVTHMQF